MIVSCARRRFARGTGSRRVRCDVFSSKFRMDMTDAVVRGADHSCPKLSTCREEAFERNKVRLPLPFPSPLLEPAHSLALMLAGPPRSRRHAHREARARLDDPNTRSPIPPLTLALSPRHTLAKIPHCPTHRLDLPDTHTLHLARLVPCCFRPPFHLTVTLVPRARPDSACCSHPLTQIAS